MGVALIKLKIMPVSPDTDLEAIKEKTKEILKDISKTEPRFEELPIAFGLKAVIAQFSIDESNEIDPIENKIKEIEEVNSTEIIDFRREFG